jgi:hypothetical protein
MFLMESLDALAVLDALERPIVEPLDAPFVGVWPLVNMPELACLELVEPEASELFELTSEEVCEEPM